MSLMFFNEMIRAALVVEKHSGTWNDRTNIQKGEFISFAVNKGEFRTTNQVQGMSFDISNFFCLSVVRFWRQQVQKKNPDKPLSNNLFQLILRESAGFCVKSPSRAKTPFLIVSAKVGR